MIGRAAKDAHFQGGGSSHINPTQVDVPFDELSKAVAGAELTYAEGYPADDSNQPALIAEAVAAARAADVALLYLALPGYKESEGYDRPDLDLTAQQMALIKAVTGVQPKTVVILNNGSAVTMSEWIDGAAAVLEAWMMGQAGGGAIADVLTGRVNPSGKLSETFPLKLSDTPAHINYPGGNGAVRYGKGIFIGYRYYDAKEMPVLFPFGHGLSYTTFAYGAPQVSAEAFRDVDGVTVSVDVTNTGPVAGKEVVQVYVHDRKSRLARPPKELKGFAKVALAPGETKTVTINLDFRRVRLLSSGLPAVDHRGRRVPHPGRRVRGQRPRGGDRDVAFHVGTALPAQPRVYHPGMDGGSGGTARLRTDAQATDGEHGGDFRGRRQRGRNDRHGHDGLHAGHAAVGHSRFPGEPPAGLSGGDGRRAPSSGWLTSRRNGWTSSAASPSGWRPRRARASRSC